MHRWAVLVTVLSCCIGSSSALKLEPLGRLTKRARATTLLKVDLSEGEGQVAGMDHPVVIEIVAKRTSTKARAASSSYSTLYKETKEDVVADVMDSPVSKIFEIALNPTTLLLALYLSSIGWSQVLWLQKFLNLFGKGALAKKKNANSKTALGGSSAAAETAEELPFQTFECEVCICV